MVLAALLEWPEKIVRAPTGKAPALVLNLDSHAIGAVPHAQINRGAGLGELEGILQEIPDRGAELVTVRLDDKIVRDRWHDQPDSLGLCLERGGGLDLVDEVSDPDRALSVTAVCRPYVRQRTIDQRTQVVETATEYLPFVARDAGAGGSEDLEGQNGHVYEIAHLVRQELVRMLAFAEARYRW